MDTVDGAVKLLNSAASKSKAKDKKLLVEMAGQASTHLVLLVLLYLLNPENRLRDLANRNSPQYRSKLLRSYATFSAHLFSHCMRVWPFRPCD